MFYIAEVVSYLKEKLFTTPEINPVIYDSTTKLHNEVIHHNFKEVHSLLEKGANPNVADKSGLTPLHHAVYSGQSPMIKLLILYGADVNAKDCLGMTPLHIAASFNDTGMVELLLEKGADPNIKTTAGATPADLVRNDEEFVRKEEIKMKMKEVLKILESNNNNCDVVTNYETTQLEEIKVYDDGFNLAEAI
ncbi:MAG: ankyrin repeat domain-containing protein [Sphingobacteriia bacterium]|nr:ankyrin repeat domain-containing protein [Sphingobacteriia bacterium]